MRKAESRRRRRRASYRYFTAGIGLLGLFLIAAGLWPGNWAWIFAVAGFLGFVLSTRQALALWKLDRLVFDQEAFRGRTRFTTSESAASSDQFRSAFVETRGPRILRWQSRTRVSSDHSSVG
jgi:MFS family permease